MTALRRLFDRLRPAAMPLCYTGITLLVFWYLWTPIAGAARTWKYDTVHQYWGDLIFQRDTLAHWHLALWNPHDRAGFPVYGDPQPGLLYPVNWLLVFAGLVAGKVSYALMEVKVVAHWIFGAVGMHLYLRRRGAAEPACYLGGTLFAFVPPALRYGGNALNWTYAWIPWVLLATDWFADQPTSRRGAVLGTAVAMTLLSGAPAVFLYMLLVAVPYGAYVMWGRLRRSAVPLGAAAAIALMWVLPLVASNLELLPYTVRESRNLSFITTSGFHPAHLLNMLVPALHGENIFYGLLPLFCFGLLVARRGGRAAVLLASAVAGLLLALGEHADVLSGLASLAPPFAMFRRAHRYLYVTTAAVAAGAGLGFGYLLSLDDPDDRRTLARWATRIGGAVTGVLGLGWVIATVLRHGKSWAWTDAFGIAVVSAAVSTFLLRALLTAGGRRRRTYAWVATLAFALELWVGVAHVMRPGLAKKPRPPHDELIASLDGVTDGSVRIFDRGFLRYRPGERLGVRDFGGYEEDPLSLSRYQAFRERAAKTPRLLGHANVRYVLVDRHREQRPRLRLHDRALRRVQKGVYQLRAVAPEIMYVPDPRRVEDENEALDALGAIEPGTGAVVEGKAPRGPPDAAVVAGRVVSREPNRLVAEIETPGPGLVVVADAYYPGWSVTVDGEKVDTLPANAMFRGVPIAAAGVHRIEMHLAPLSFWGTLPLYALALALFGWAVVVEIRRRRAPKR